MSRSETVDGNNKKLVRNFYITDTVPTSTTMKNMLDSHNLSPILKSESYSFTNNKYKLTDATRIIYYNPDQSNKTLICPQKIEQWTPHKGWLTTNSLKFDNKGNIIEQQDANGTPTSYIWSYGGNHIVAYIENSSAESTANALSSMGESIASLRDFKSPSESTFLKLNKLQSLLPKSLTNIYRYSQLVGMTESSSPNQNKTYFDYDGYGKLRKIRNTSKNITEEFEYNILSVSKLNANFNCKERYYANELASITSKISGGSGLYAINWSISNSAGTTILEIESNETLNFTPISSNLTSLNEYIIKHTVTDLVSDENVDIAKKIYVDATPIKFINVDTNINLSASMGSVNAQIFSDREVTVKFLLDCKFSGKANLEIGDLKYQYSQSQIGTIITCPIPSGYTNVNLSITDSPAENVASLEIIDAGFHDISSPNTLKLEF